MRLQRSVRLVFGVALLGLICHAPLAARAEDGTKPAPSGLKQRVDAYLAPLIELDLFSGTVLLAKGGDVLVHKAYGQADIDGGVRSTTDTKYKLMSVTKSITAVATMRLIQDGKLRLDDTVSKHLDAWPLGWKGVTVHHLLEHTSGLPNLENSWAQTVRRGAARGLSAWPDFAAQQAGAALQAPPGSQSRYSNFNYVLLALLIEARSGEAYPAYVRKVVLGPARMAQTGFDTGARSAGLSIGYFRGADGSPTVSTQDMSVIRGAGDIFSSASDLHRLDRALRGDTILDAGTRKRMVTPTRASPRYACGWQVSRVHERACVHHSGGANGYVADFLRFPDDDACVVVLSNYAFSPVGRVSHALAGLLFGREVQSPRRPPVRELEACTGLYTSMEGDALLVRRSGKTLGVFHARRAQPRCGFQLLVPMAEDVYEVPFGAERLQFSEAKKEGYRIVRLRWTAAPFERTKPPLDAWKQAAGSYESTPGRVALRVAAVGERLSVHDVARGATLEFLPLTPSLGLALWGPSFATLVRLERDGDGGPTRLHWVRNDGSVVKARTPESR